MSEIKREVALAVLAVMVCGLCSAATDFALVDGDVVASVVIPQTPDESTRLAAAELTNYVFKITGRQMPVVTRGNAANAAPEVVIGTLKALSDVPQSITRRLDATDNPEAACVATDGNTLWIVGKDEVAELYATYHFLESKLGVRWFQAPVKDDPGEWVPKMERIVIAPFAELREPVFTMRRLDSVACVAQYIAVNGVSTAIRNGYQVFPPFGARVPYDKKDSREYKFWAPRVERRRLNVGGGGHLTFQSVIPKKKYFAEHPEYFAEVDGKRTADDSLVQYCLSNPDVRRLVAEDIIRRFDATGGQGCYSFGMADSSKGSCMCANCRALDDEPVYKTAKANVSGRYFKTINDIASRVWKKWPDADLRTWAYDIYWKIPKGVKFDTRFFLQFCSHGRCLGHRLDDPTCARNAGMLPFIKEWHAVAPKMGFYDYAEVASPSYQCRTLDEASDLKLYKRLGIFGWKNEAHFSDAYHWPRKSAADVERRAEIQPSNWQWLYVTGKLLWNPDLDARAILDEAESLYYGPAYPAMKKYQDLRRRLWTNNRACLGFAYGNSRMGVLLNVPGSREELLGYLDEAERLAGETGVYRRRVGLDRKWLTLYWIKPNDIVRAKAGKSFRAVRAKTPIVVDGRDDEGAWVGAFYTDDIRKVYGDKKPLEDARKMSYGILRDDDNLYFFVRAKEPDMASLRVSKSGDAWDADGVEIFLFPPAMENKNYHIAANPDGALWVATEPGGVQKDKLGITAAGTKGRDSWTIELKVPTKKIHPLVDGETWKVLLGANRGKDICSSDGEYFDTSNYRPMDVGDPYLRNGSFGVLNEKGLPKDWDLHGKTRVVQSGGGNALFIESGYAIALMAHGALAQSDKPRRLRYSVTAKGPGTLSVGFGHFADTIDPTAPHGYRRKYTPPRGKSEKFVLTDAQSVCAGEHTVEPGEWDAIVVYGSSATVYAVSVTPL